jgi:hypothetical protein
MPEQIIAPVDATITPLNDPQWIRVNPMKIMASIARVFDNIFTLTFQLHLRNVKSNPSATITPLSIIIVIS